MRNFLLAALAVLLVACVTPPPAPEEQAAIFGPVPAAPREAELAAAKALFDPIWLQRPTLDEMHLAYPRNAWERDVEARLLLNCLVRQTGHLACVARDDGMPNYDFEQAGLHISTRLRVGEHDRRGEPTVGRRLDVPLHFVLR
jgi:hypothetical protein